MLERMTELEAAALLPQMWQSEQAQRKIFDVKKLHFDLTLNKIVFFSVYAFLPEKSLDLLCMKR